jgi:hypothetical protein
MALIVALLDYFVPTTHYTTVCRSTSADIHWQLIRIPRFILQPIVFVQVIYLTSQKEYQEKVSQNAHKNLTKTTTL